HTRSYGDWSSDVCSSDLILLGGLIGLLFGATVGVLLAAIIGHGARACRSAEDFPVRFRCCKCNKALKAREKWTGKRGKCTKCGKIGRASCRERVKRQRGA